MLCKVQKLFSIAQLKQICLLLSCLSARLCVMIVLSQIDRNKISSVSSQHFFTQALAAAEIRKQRDFEFHSHHSQGSSYILC